MNFGMQFQNFRVGTPLFSGGSINVLMALYPKSVVCSCFQQQTGIPYHLFDVIIKICCCITPSWICQFRVLKGEQFIQELLAYTNDVTNPAAMELASRINEDAVMEWLHADVNVTSIHHYTDSEIVHMVVSSEKNGSEEESSDENEEDVRERIYIDKLIKNCNHFVTIYTTYIESGDKTSIIRKFRKSGSPKVPWLLD